MPKILNPAFVNHIRLTMTGTMDATVQGGQVIEEFAYRLNLSDPANSADKAGQAADFAADAVAFHGAVDTQIGGIARLTEVKVARIGPDGRYREDPILVPVDARGAHGAFLMYPPQVALAVSLLTARRGPRGKGRFYLPAPCLPISAVSGLTSALDRARVATSVQTFLNNINNRAGLDANAPEVVVASTAGHNTVVNAVRVGLALDTIRSRRGDLPEAYSAPLAVA